MNFVSLSSGIVHRNVYGDYFFIFAEGLVNVFLGGNIGSQVKYPQKEVTASSSRLPCAWESPPHPRRFSPRHCPGDYPLLHRRCLQASVRRRPDADPPFPREQHMLRAGAMDAQKGLCFRSGKLACRGHQDPAEAQGH